MCSFLSELDRHILQWSRHSCACNDFPSLNSLMWMEVTLVCRCPLGSSLLISKKSPPQTTPLFILQTRIVVDRHWQAFTLKYPLLGLWFQSSWLVLKVSTLKQEATKPKNKIHNTKSIQSRAPRALTLETSPSWSLHTSPDVHLCAHIQGTNTTSALFLREFPAITPSPAQEFPHPLPILSDEGFLY